MIHLGGSRNAAARQNVGQDVDFGEPPPQPGDSTRTTGAGVGEDQDGFSGISCVNLPLQKLVAAAILGASVSGGLIAEPCRSRRQSHQDAHMGRRESVSTRHTESQRYGRYRSSRPVVTRFVLRYPPARNPETGT